MPNANRLLIASLLCVALSPLPGLARDPGGQARLDAENMKAQRALVQEDLRAQQRLNREETQSDRTQTLDELHLRHQLQAEDWRSQGIARRESLDAFRQVRLDETSDGDRALQVESRRSQLNALYEQHRSQARLHSEILAASTERSHLGITTQSSASAPHRRFEP